MIFSWNAYLTFWLVLLLWGITLSSNRQSTHIVQRHYLSTPPRVLIGSSNFSRFISLITKNILLEVIVLFLNRLNFLCNAWSFFSTKNLIDLFMLIVSCLAKCFCWNWFWLLSIWPLICFLLRKQSNNFGTFTCCRTIRMLFHLSWLFAACYEVLLLIVEHNGLPLNIYWTYCAINMLTLYVFLISNQHCHDDTSIVLNGSVFLSK